MTRVCDGCAKELGRKNTSGLCRSCLAHRLNADPETAARRLAAIKARFARPEVLEAHRARLRLHMATMSDAERSRRSERGRQLYCEVLTRPDVVAKREASRLTPEANAARGRKLSDRMLPWCPEQYRPLYRDLRRTGVPTADARSAVEAQIVHDERRRRAALTPHERQMERVRNGARLIEKPVIRSADPAFTLGGVASGML